MRTAIEVLNESQEDLSTGTEMWRLTDYQIESTMNEYATEVVNTLMSRIMEADNGYIMGWQIINQEYNKILKEIE